jgi:hypothetical protein
MLRAQRIFYFDSVSLEPQATPSVPGRRRLHVKGSIPATETATRKYLTIGIA